MPMPSFFASAAPKCVWRPGSARTRCAAAGAFYSTPSDSLAVFGEWGKRMIGREMDRGKGWGDRKGRRGVKGMKRREG